MTCLLQSCKSFKTTYGRCFCVTCTLLAICLAPIFWAVILRMLTCTKANLPVFANVTEFRDSPWATYVTLLYGEDSPPILDIHSLTILYITLLKQSNIHVQTAHGWCLCSAEKGIVTRAGRQQEWDPPDTLWQWNGKRTAHTNHSRVEVTHCSAAFKPDLHNREAHGAWFYITPGSGIFLDLGRTRAFNTHQEAAYAFLDDRVQCAPQCSHFFYDIVEKARELGLDSIQFLHHADQRCGNMAIEVLYLNGNGIHPCANTTLFTFDGSECRCDHTKRCANCDFNKK